ncbi:coiled-coil domain-containing protein 40-like [Sycon ciliatum]|uniref:coiled-coil domain-containing protein 40-like n=1 Tax=Sycon ciliatum TaxID=27933 RepID=UPI0031F69163
MDGGEGSKPGSPVEADEGAAAAPAEREATPTSDATAQSATVLLTVGSGSQVSQASRPGSSQDASAGSSVANVVSRVTVQALRHMRMKSANESARASTPGNTTPDLGQADDGSVAADAGSRSASRQSDAAASRSTTATGLHDGGSARGTPGSGSAGGLANTQGDGDDTLTAHDFGSTGRLSADDSGTRESSRSSTRNAYGRSNGGRASGGGGDGDDDGDDGDDGDDDDEDYAGFDVEVGDHMDDDDDDDNGLGNDADDMMVMEPDHPLMQQFQTQVTVQLTAQKEQLELKKAEKMKTLKEREKERDELGVSLYNLQQQLAKHQSQLEQHQEQLSEISEKRKQCELALHKAKKIHQECLTNLRGHHKQVEEIRSKLDKATLELRRLEVVAEKMRSEVEIRKREAEKVDQDAVEAEEAKQQQDVYITTLINQLDRLNEQVNLYKMQLAAQVFETQQSKVALSDSIHELEVLNMEKKDLLNQWNGSLRAIKNRDEALSALQDAIRREDERIIAVNSELSGFNRSIAKEQERHEALTTQRGKLANELAMVQSQLEQCREKQRSLQMDYQSYTRSLHQVEQQLQKAQTDRTLRLQEIDGVRQQTEREVAERLHLEDTILEKTMTMLTLDKAAQYSQKVLAKLRAEEKRRVKGIIETQGDIERTKLDIDNTQAERDDLAEALADLGKQLDERNQLISHSEAEIKKRNVIIERKQSRIDQLNKKISQVLQERGGKEDVGPLELTIKTLKKQIEDSQEECRRQQQFWMRQEHELVKRVKEAQQQTKDIEQQKKKLIILEQKKIRQEAEIETEKKDLATVGNEIRQMQLDMVRLNAIISEKRGQQQNLKQDNILLESDYFAQLKDAEREIMTMKLDISANEEAKERLKNSLIESEQQIMLWEKKIQIARETSQTLASDEMEGEIRLLKGELHTMQTRYDEVKRKQQSLIRLMENSVKQRATINFKAEVKSTTGKTQQTKGHLKKQVEGMARKLQQSRRNSASCDQKIEELNIAQREMAGYIQEKQRTCQAMAGVKNKLYEESAAERSEKERLGFEVRWLQARQRHYANAAAGRYNPLLKKREGGPILDEELIRYKNQTQSLLSVSDELKESCPQLADTIQSKLLIPLRLRLRTFAP